MTQNDGDKNLFPWIEGQTHRPVLQWVFMLLPRESSLLSSELFLACGMKHERWLIGYGVFLFACGIAGFLSNPTEAKTALISGSVFGGLAVLWGVLLGKGHGFAKWAALGMSVMLCGVFSWRSTVSWQAVMDGKPKEFAATLISLMLIGSIATVVKLLRR